MNTRKAYILCVILLFSGSAKTIANNQAEFFEKEESQGQNENIKSVESLQEEVDDAHKFIMAFEALKYALANKGCYIPYSQEYMSYICSDKFKSFIVDKLTSK